MQHLPRDKVSIFALQNQKTLEESLQSPESSAESRALARLANHSGIKAAVEVYRDRNPHWVLQIPVLLEKSKAKQKLSDKKAEKKAKPVQEEVPSAEIISESDCDSKKVESPIPEKPKKPVPISKKTPKPTKKTPTPITSFGKVEGTVKIQVLKDLADLESESSPKKSKTDFVSDDFVQKKRPKSSFFIGGVDEPVKDKVGKYTELPQNQSSFNKPQHTDSKPIFRKGKLVKPLNRAGRRQEIHGKPQRNFDKSYNSNSNPNRIPVTKTVFEKRQSKELLLICMSLRCN